MNDDAEAFGLVMKSMGDAAMKARRQKYQKPQPKPTAPEAPAEPSVQDLEALLNGG